MSEQNLQACPTSARLHRQQKWVWGAIAAVAAALTLLWAVGGDVFQAGKASGEKVRVQPFIELSVRVGKNEEAIDRIDKSLESMDEKLNQILKAVK